MEIDDLRSRPQVHWIPIDNSAAFILSGMPLVNPRRPFGTVLNLVAVDRFDAGEIEPGCKVLNSLLNRRAYFDAG
jgi:hypothetical protein